MEVEGSKNDKQQTHFLDLNTPKWDVWGTFTTNQPLPTVKIRLFLENSNTLALNDELLSKVRRDQDKLFDYSFYLNFSY